MTEMMEPENKDTKQTFKYISLTFKRIEKNINIMISEIENF